MVKTNYKGRVIKKSVSKSDEVCRIYGDIQLAYLDALQNDGSIVKINCNVPLDEEGIKEYTTDFLCVGANGEYMVRECVSREQLLRKKTVQLLDASRKFWMKHGVKDWGLVINAKQ